MMLYKNFQDKNLSALGFGAMRLPMKDGAIDTVVLKEMIDYAMEHGVNYYDTAYPYHEGFSEIELCKILASYDRDSYFLATKYPGHVISDHYDPAEVFEDQLKKCKVDYFDFYLLHNVCESSYDVYTDPQWGIIDYFVEQKRQGRIKHLGFSTHAGLETLEKFLDTYGDVLEFCQIQLNYLDWTLQKGREKCELLATKNIPIWVMEPVRGGRLANLTEAETAKMEALRPGATPASWCFDWLMTVPEVTMVLSGMSNPEQMQQNIETFSKGNLLSEEEISLLYELAEGMKDSVPCTACRYCTKGCPMELDIPTLIAAYNDLKLGLNFTPIMLLEDMPEEKLPSACIGCGACAAICPQKIEIPEVLSKLAERFAEVPKWKEISVARELAAKELRESGSY